MADLIIVEENKFTGKMRALVQEAVFEADTPDALADVLQPLVDELFGTLVELRLRHYLLYGYDKTELSNVRSAQESVFAATPGLGRCLKTKSHPRHEWTVVFGEYGFVFLCIGIPSNPVVGIYCDGDRDALWSR